MSIMDTLENDNKLELKGNSEEPKNLAPGTPMSSAQVSPRTPERPATPPQTLRPGLESQAPRTPEIKITAGTLKQTPRTPSSSSRGTGVYPPNSASTYLSSPIRRRRVHQNILNAGSMTPGRPNLHYGMSSPSPYKVSKRVPNSPSTNGKVQLNSMKTLPNLPLQTVFFTEEQVANIDNLEQCRQMLVASLDESTKYKKAAQQFRSIASNNLFQLSLNKIEHEESQQRHEVEASIQQKEIEKLIVDIMGYNDQNTSAEQIRMKLRSTNNKIKELNNMLDMKDQIIADLQQKLEQERHSGYQNLSNHAQLQSHDQSQQTSNLMHSSPANHNRVPSGFSALEVLASQVLSSGINSEDSNTARPPNTAMFSSPYQQHNSNSQSFSSQRSVESPTRSRRPSSSSTISAVSEEDTLEEASL